LKKIYEPAYFQIFEPRSPRWQIIILLITIFSTDTLLMNGDGGGERGYIF